MELRTICSVHIERVGKKMCSETSTQTQRAVHCYRHILLPRVASRPRMAWPGGLVDHALAVAFSKCFYTLLGLAWNLLGAYACSSDCQWPGIMSWLQRPWHWFSSSLVPFFSCTAAPQNRPHQMPSWLHVPWVSDSRMPHLLFWASPSPTISQSMHGVEHAPLGAIQNLPPWDPQLCCPREQSLEWGSPCHSRELVISLANTLGQKDYSLFVEGGADSTKGCCSWIPSGL